MAMAVSNQQSRDAALLRAMTELFTLEKKHDAEALRRFEELATHYLGRVGPADRAFAAEKLSRSPDAPAAVLRLLGSDILDIAGPILKRSPALGEFDLLTIIAATGHPHHRLIALRRDLTPLVVSALRLTGDAEVIARLAAYPEVILEPAGAPGTDLLFADAAPALIEPVLAEPEADIPAMDMAADAEPRAIGSQDDAPPPLAEAITALESGLAPDEVEDAANGRDAAPASLPPQRFPAALAEALAAGLHARSEALQMASSQPETAPAPPRSGAVAFLDLDRSERLALLRRLGEPASPAAAAGLDITADQAFRTALGRARLPSIARQRQRDALIRALAQGLRLDESDVAALLDDPSGEALVVLLRGIGLSESEALQVLLFANPVIAEGVASFERLGRLLVETSEAAASELIALWRGERTARPAAPPPSGHQPLFADLPMRRGLHGSAGEFPQSAAPAAIPERDVAGSRGR